MFLFRRNCRETGRLFVISFGVDGGFGTSEFCVGGMLGSERLIICVGFPGFLFGVDGGLGTTCWWVVRIFFRGRINVEHFRVPKGSAPRCPFGVDGGLGIIVSLIDGIFGKTAFMLGKQAFLFSFGG